MRLLILPIVCSLLATLLRAEEKTLLDQLPQSGLQSAFQILRRDYIRRDDLTFEALNRAALQGLLERLNFGAELVAAGKEENPAKPQVHAEFLEPGIAYLRPETFGGGEAGLFEKALLNIVDKKARHLILDLRTAAAPGSFDEAARMLECFVPAGETMFKLKQMGRDDAESFVSKREPIWTRNMVVLIDCDTGNVAEALAACLAQRRRALLIGRSTRGGAVQYSEVKLDGGCALRYASAEMLLPDGSSLFQKGITPAVVVRAAMEEKRKVMTGSRDARMKLFITEQTRLRFNERALALGGDPEFDDYVRRCGGKPPLADTGQVQDQVTQLALDLLKSAELIAQSRLDWLAKPTQPEPSPGEQDSNAPPDYE